MSRKKRRKSFIDKLFGGSSFNEMDEIFGRFGNAEMSSGYSINVTQTTEGTRVYAKVGKEIEIESGKPLIREISTKPVEEEGKEKRHRKEDGPRPE